MKWPKRACQSDHKMWCVESFVFLHFMRHKDFVCPCLNCLVLSLKVTLVTQHAEFLVWFDINKVEKSFPILSVDAISK